jgi:hypothetical protein
MCLIIEKPEGELVDPLLVEAAYQNNADGFGVMMPTANGGIHVHRVMPESAADCQKVIDKYGKRAMGIHFRMATHGDINKSQCHPFPILTPKKHGRAMYLMHNGILSNASRFDDAKSDTWHFIEYVLRPILADYPGLIYDRDFQDMLSDMIHSDKLLILDGETGEFVKINEVNGTQADGLWLSNTYSLRRNKGMNYDPVTGTIITPKALPRTTYGGYVKPAVPLRDDPMMGTYEDDYWYSKTGYYSRSSGRWITAEEIADDRALLEANKLEAEALALEKEDELDIIDVDPTPWINTPPAAKRLLALVDRKPQEDKKVEADINDEYDNDANGKVIELGNTNWAQEQEESAYAMDPSYAGNQITTEQIMYATDLEIFQWTTSNPDGMAELLISLVR